MQNQDYKKHLREYDEYDDDYFEDDSFGEELDDLHPDDEEIFEEENILALSGSFNDDEEIEFVDFDESIEILEDHEDLFDEEGH